MKIKVVDVENEELTELEMDDYRNLVKGNHIGFWLNEGDEWAVCEILQIVYEFDKFNKMDFVTIETDYDHMDL